MSLGLRSGFCDRILCSGAASPPVAEIVRARNSGVALGGELG